MTFSGGMGLGSKGAPSLPTSAWKPPIELLNEVPNHGLSELEFFGCRWMKPDDHETYLESLFGDWRTPNPNYHYLTDSRAVIARSPWQGG